jgi:hypothetical protein
MKKTAILVLLFNATGHFGAVFGDAENSFFSGNMIWYPNVRVVGDIGLDYGMNGIASAEPPVPTPSSSTSGPSYSSRDLSYIERIYDMASPGLGMMIQAGVELETLAVWHGKSVVGAELYAIGGYLNADNASRYLIGAGFAGTLLWIGKIAFELGYSGSLDPIPVPINYVSSYTFSSQRPGGLFFGLDLGLEVPIVVVPNISVSACYRYFTEYVTDAVSAYDYHDEGYWLSRNSVCVGLSYMIGSGMEIPLE